MPVESLIRRIVARPFFRWIVVTYIVVIVVAGAFSFTVKLDQQRMYSDHEIALVGIHQEKLYVRLDDIEDQIESIKKLIGAQEIDSEQIDKLVASVAEIEKLKNTPEFTLPKRLTEVEELSSTISSDLANLKSALNPTRPEEILTVLRLGDKFELFSNQIEVIQKEVAQLRINLNNNIQGNYEKLTQHIDSVTGMMGWIALLLIPALLSTIRDLFPNRKQHAESEPAGTPKEPT